MAKISIKELVKIVDFLDEINDPRRTKYGNIQHKPADIIVIVFTAALCGYEDYEEMEELGRLKQGFFKEFLELPNGIPDESAFRRVLQCLNANELKRGLERRLAAIKEREKAEGAAARLVNIDGKTIREKEADYIPAVKENQKTLYRESIALDAGYSVSGGRVPCEDRERGAEFEHLAEACAVQTEEDDGSKETGKRQTPYDVCCS